VDVYNSIPTDHLKPVTCLGVLIDLNPKYIIVLAHEPIQIRPSKTEGMLHFCVTFHFERSKHSPCVVFRLLPSCKLSPLSHTFQHLYSVHL